MPSQVPSKQYSGTLHGLMRFYVLHLLSKRKYYGYEIMETIREKTGGAWNFSSGALYPLLKRMERDGLIKGYSEGGRNVYEITDDGKVALAGVKDKLSSLLENWDNYRGILEDFVGRNQLVKISLIGYQNQFRFLKDAVKLLGPSEASDLLKRVKVELDSQMIWIDDKLNEVNEK
ncbi:MAG: PadR family transcriptional regulator [Thermoprotei archaeon]